MVLGTVRAFIYSTVRSTPALQITNIPTPITFNQVQGMLNDLKNTLTTALSTAVANQHNSNASNHLTNNSDVQCTSWT